MYQIWFYPSDTSLARQLVEVADINQDALAETFEMISVRPSGLLVVPGYPPEELIVFAPDVR